MHFTHTSHTRARPSSFSCQTFHIADMQGCRVFLLRILRLHSGATYVNRQPRGTATIYDDNVARGFSSEPPLTYSCNRSNEGKKKEKKTNTLVRRRAVLHHDVSLICADTRYQSQAARWSPILQKGTTCISFGCIVCLSVLWCGTYHSLAWQIALAAEFHDNAHLPHHETN